jgi:hypothetical protein
MECLFSTCELCQLAKYSDEQVQYILLLDWHDFRLLALKHSTYACL